VRDPYSEEENRIILHQMRGVDETDFGQVLKRSYYIHDNYLTHRTPEAICQHWRWLVGQTGLRRRGLVPDLQDLLSPEQRRRIRLRIPVPQGIVRKIEGS